MLWSIRTAGRISRQISLPVVTLAVGCCICIFGVLGALQLTGTLHGNGMSRLFSLDAELAGPAVFSSGLLIGGSIAALALSYFSLETRIWSPTTVAFGLLLGFMALDELVSLHERLERWTGIDWQLLYLPVGAVAAAVWLVLLRGLVRYGTGGVPLLCGGLVWLLSQAFEFVQWGGFNSDRVAHRWAVVPEEILEMSGSALFALGLLAALQAAALLRFASPSRPARAGKNRRASAK